MSIRDARVLQSALELPFEGYARRRGLVIAPDGERIVALVAVLGTMVLSGVVLGRSRS